MISDELNAAYRELKAARTAALMAQKRDNNGKWPDEVKDAAKAAELSVTDYVCVAQSHEGQEAIAQMDRDLRSLSDARRLLQKPSRQKAAAERKVNVAAKVAAMTAEEKAAFKAALGD